MMNHISEASNHISAKFSEALGKDKAQDARLRKVCAEFESIFINYMLKSARKALPENALFDRSNESKIYKSMMDEQMARCVTKGRGVGLGELLYDALSEGEAKASSLVSEYL